MLLVGLILFLPEWNEKNDENYQMVEQKILLLYILTQHESYVRNYYQ